MENKKEYILGIDQGGTGSKVVIMDKYGAIVQKAYRRISCNSPQNGYTENDPYEIWNSVKDSIIELSQNFDFSKLRAIGISNQRETFLIWDKATGVPVTPAITYFDLRAADIHASWEPMFEEIQERIHMAPGYFLSASKVTWVFRTYPELLERANKGELCFGHVNVWLLYKLSGGKSFYTDSSNAARTEFFDLKNNRYEKTLMEKMEIPETILPEVLPCDGDFGLAVEPAEAFKTPVPVRAMIGDQMSALFGQTCFKRGEAKCTIGTCISVTVQTGKIEKAESGFNTAFASNLGGELTYEVEGSTLGGTINEWLIEKMQIVKSPEEISTLAQEVDGSHGLTFVPAFAGLGAPYWASEARACLIGLTEFHDKRHICRAAEEALALLPTDVIEALDKSYGIRVDTLRVDGGAAKNDYLCQLISDMTRCKVLRPTNTESTVTGAIYIAGLASGLWKDKDELSALWQLDKEFTPKLDKKERDLILTRWYAAVDRCLDWNKVGSDK